MGWCWGKQQQQTPHCTMYVKGQTKIAGRYWRNQPVFALFVTFFFPTNRKNAFKDHKHNILVPLCIKFYCYKLVDLIFLFQWPKVLLFNWASAKWACKSFSSVFLPLKFADLYDDINTALTILQFCSKGRQREDPTMRVGLWKSLSGNQVHDGRPARWQL